MRAWLLENADAFSAEVTSAAAAAADRQPSSSGAAAAAVEHPKGSEEAVLKKAKSGDAK
jgi:hypothetical protein